MRVAPSISRPSSEQVHEALEIPRLEDVEREDDEFERIPAPPQRTPRVDFDARRIDERQLRAILALALQEGGTVIVGGDTISDLLGRSPEYAVARIEGTQVYLEGQAAPMSIEQIALVMHRVRIEGAPEAEQAAFEQIAQADYEDTYSAVARNLLQPLEMGFHRLRSRWHASRARTQARVLEILERIEAGEGVPRRLQTVPNEIAGYYQMNPERRRALLERLRASVPEAIAAYSSAERAASEVPRSPLLERVAAAETFAEGVELLTEDAGNTTALFSQLFFGSLASNPDTYLAGAAGAWIAGPWGARLAAGAASANGEYAAGLSEALRAHGVDVTDPEAVAAAWSDPALMASVETFAERRALAVGLFTTVGYGNPFGGGTARQVANSTFQAGADAAGEAAAQWASTGELGSPGEVLLEGGGGVVTGPVEAATVRLRPMASDVDVLPTPVFTTPDPFVVLQNPTPGTRTDAEIDAANRAAADGQLGAPAPLEESLIQRLPGYELRDTNEAYGRLAAEATNELRAAIAKGEVRSFDEALEFLSPRVLAISEKIGRTDLIDPASPGRRRSAEMNTGIAGRYGEYADASREVLDIFGESFGWRANEEGIELTAHIRRYRGAPTWFHAAPYSFPAIAEKAEAAWRAAQAADAPRAVVEAVAELHWWGANMAPFERGSAATIDMIAKALLLEGGIEPGRWREGVGVDLEAFLQSREAFVRAYASYHEP